MNNKYSSRVTQPRSQGASQAMLYGIGLTDADLQKPQVGICSMWYEGNTCNMHLDRLAAHVKEGVQAAGLVGLRFNTIGVSDGLSMGTDGMSYSLPSRDLIADSIETVMGAQWYASLVTGPGCDKNMPGSVIAMARLNRPSLMVYGGTIRAGHALGKPRDIISAFQSYGEYLAGVITDDQRKDIVRHACPGAGASEACTRRTPWRWRSRPWDCRCPTVRRCRRKIRVRRTNAGAPAQPCSRFSKRI
jgi:dihydroxy-acid dehydratase